ncbi:MAG: amidohydrolase family protein, partial [Planctomycetia bacterium]
RRNAVDLGDAAVTPGLVNAHCHLDLAFAAGRPPPPRPAGSLAAWLEQIVALRRATGDGVKNVVTEGVAQLLSGGATFVADVAAGGSSAAALTTAGVPAVVYREVLGLRSVRYEPLWSAAVNETTPKPNGSPPVVLDGISPHAPYSTAVEVYRRAAVAPAPVATHWLESAEERSLLLEGRGPLLDFLRRMGAWDAAEPWPTVPAASLWETYLQPRPDGSRWLLVHVNAMTAVDFASLDAVRSRVAGVVYCPRTHAYFGHPPHPWRELVRRGVPVALGTDSRCSSPDLSLFEEMRFAAGISGGPSPSEALAMATRHGAAALELGPAWGRLPTAAPAPAAFTLIQTRAAGEAPAEPAELLVADGARPIGSWAAGRWLLGPPV